MSESYNILMTEPAWEHREAIEASAPGCAFRFYDRENEQALTLADYQWADIVLGQINPAFIADCPGLKWIQTGSAGVEQYLKPGVLPENVRLTNASGAYGLAIGEYMAAVMLMIQKKLHLYRDAQRSGQWKSLGNVTSVYGSRVLVLGTGDIGSEFASRCKAMGAYVIGLRRRQGGKPDFVDEICLTEELDRLLPEADVVAITLPGTRETAGMMSRGRINSMKKGAILLNVGRGNIVDTEALCDALESGHLLGAGLDVVDPEPLPKEHRLWQIPSAVVTPHISGQFHLKETHNRIMGIFMRNLKNFLSGKELENTVNRESGY